MEDVVILGTGAAGLTAAIYTARANLNPLVLHGDLWGGQLTTTSEVENWPGFEEGIDGKSLMDTMQKQAERFGARIEMGYVKETVLERESGKPIRLGVVDHKDIEEVNKWIETKCVIIATGASPRMLGVPGEAEFFGDGGVSSCATCDGAFTKDKVAVVIGGGDSAMEEAHFLTRYATKVYLVHRRDSFRASQIMQDRVLANEKIEVLWNTTVTEVYGTVAAFGKTLKGVKLKDTVTGDEREFETDWMFLAIGHIPNVAPFGGLELDASGYIKTDHTKTALPGVFAAGDVQDHTYRQAITAAGSGCMAALEAERYLETLH